MLIPTVGPLVDGHVMIIPRRHGQGSISEPPALQLSIRQAMRHFLKLAESVGGNALYGEHCGRSGGGPCIEHTHIHLLPGIGYLVERLASLLPAQRDQQASGFMMYGRIGLEMRCDSATAQGQHFRRSIATELGLDTWDFAVFPNPDGVERTIRLWRSLLG